MKEKYIKILCLVLGVFLLGVINAFYKNNNLIFLSSKDKEELMEILKIEEADSFYPIRKKRCSTGFHGSDPNYYEIIFEISIKDYEKNKLNYQEISYYEVLIDCHYKEKKDKNTYTCILRVSDFCNEELFYRLANL